MAPRIGVTISAVSVAIEAFGVNHRTIAEPLEEQVETSGGLVAHTETWGAICAVGLVADVVLEKTLSTVVCEALRQLDHRNEVCGGRQVLANAAQSSFLVLIRLLSISRGLEVSGLGSFGRGSFLIDSVRLGDVSACDCTALLAMALPRKA